MIANADHVIEVRGWYVDERKAGIVYTYVYHFQIRVWGQSKSGAKHAKVSARTGEDILVRER